MNLRATEETILAADNAQHHQPGCDPGRDPRLPCDCTALVTMRGVGVIRRPPGIGGGTLIEIAANLGASSVGAWAPLLKSELGKSLAEGLRGAFTAMRDLEKTNSGDVDELIAAIVATVRGLRPESVSPLGTLPPATEPNVDPRTVTP